MDCEESDVWKPRPLAGIIVDWQMKVLTVLAPSPFSLWESVLDRSVTLSVHTAKWSLNKENIAKLLHLYRPPFKKSNIFCMCVLISSHLSSTQTDIELMEVLSSFRGKAWTIHQWPYRPKRAEVIRQGHVAFCVGEVTVTVTKTVVLKNKQEVQGCVSQNILIRISWFPSQRHQQTLSLLLAGPQGLQASGPGVASGTR